MKCTLCTVHFNVCVCSVQYIIPNNHIQKISSFNITMPNENTENLSIKIIVRNVVLSVLMTLLGIYIQIKTFALRQRGIFEYISFLLK